MLYYEIKSIDYSDCNSIREKVIKEHNSAYSLCEELLKQRLNIDKAVILKNKNGKPYIENSSYFISISHTRGYVAAAVSDVPVGIDIENTTGKIAVSIPRFAKRFFTDREYSHLEKTSFDIVEFYRIWTEKEAILKMMGGTLSGISGIDVFDYKTESSVSESYVLSVCADK